MFIHFPSYNNILAASATTTYTSVHPAVPTSPPAPGSPMRVPRRNVGPPLEPPPPPPSSSHSPLTRRHGSFEGAAHQWQASQEGSPHIRRVDSPRSGQFSPTSLHTCTCRCHICARDCTLYVQPLHSLPHPEFSSNGVVSPPQSAGIHGGGGDMRMGRGISSGLPPLPPSAMLGPTADPRRYELAILLHGPVLDQWTRVTLLSLLHSTNLAVGSTIDSPIYIAQ